MRAVSDAFLLLETHGPLESCTEPSIRPAEQATITLNPKP